MRNFSHECRQPRPRPAEAEFEPAATAKTVSFLSANGYPIFSRPAEFRHDDDTMCIPLESRDYEVHGVAELEGVPSRPIAERAFRDFARPFGLLAQISAKLEDLD